MAGVVLGYLMLAVTLVLMAIVVPAMRNGWNQAQQDAAQSTVGTSPSASHMLHEAEMLVLSGKTYGTANGNSTEAQQLAEQYSQSMGVMRDVLFTADQERLMSLTDGEFVTYCELYADRCVFIVHVPSYRHFDAKAKELLSELAWTTAQRTVDSKLQPGDRLAVGLRGTLLYGAVLTGRVAADGEQEVAPHAGERDDLLAFFLESTPDRPQPRPPASGPLEAAQDEPRLADSTSPPAPDPAKVAWQPQPGEAGGAPPAAPIPTPTKSPSRTPNVTAPARRQREEPPKINPDLVRQFTDIGWGIESLAFAPHGEWLLAGKMDQMLVLFDVQTGARLSVQEKLTDLGTVSQVALSPDGQWCAAAGSNGGILVAAVDEAGRFGQARLLNRHGRGVRCLAFSPSASFLMSGAADGELIWQTHGGSTSSSRRQKAFPRYVLAIHLPQQGLEALATDGETLARNNLKKADIVDSRPLRHGPAQFAAFSPDGGLLALRCGYEIQLWDTATGARQATLDGGREMQWSVAFLPNGRQLISGGRGRARLWNWADSQAVHEFDLGGVLYIKTLAISPDGTRLVTIPAAAGQTLSILPHGA